MPAVRPVPFRTADGTHKFENARMTDAELLAEIAGILTELAEMRKIIARRNREKPNAKQFEHDWASSRDWADHNIDRIMSNAHRIADTVIHPDADHDEFEAVGKERGACGHQHLTFAEADACRAKDNEKCKKLGGYSDRRVVQHLTKSRFE